MLTGLRSPSIKEPPVATSINGEPVGHFHALEVFENVSETNFYPQTIADLVSNTYFRLTYQKPEGTSAAFGTSIVGATSFRTADKTFNFIPHVTSAVVDTGDPHRLRISVLGVYRDLASLSSVRTYATKAGVHQTTMNMEVTLTALREIHLDKLRIGYDSFRLFSISSMYASPLQYDGNLIKYKRAHETRSMNLHSIEKRERYIFDASRGVSELALLRETGSANAHDTEGSQDSPSIRVRVIGSSIPIEELGLQAYLADSTNVDDDSLSIWLEWTDCPVVIPKGRTVSAKIEFSAVPAEGEPND